MAKEDADVVEVLRFNYRVITWVTPLMLEQNMRDYIREWREPIGWVAISHRDESMHSAMYVQAIIKRNI